MCAKQCKVHINIRNTTYLSFSLSSVPKHETILFFSHQPKPSISETCVLGHKQGKKIIFLSLSLSLPQWYSNLVMLVLFLTLSIIVNPVASVKSFESYKKSSYGGVCSFFLYFLYIKKQKAHYISTNTLICKYLCVPKDVMYI